MALFKKSTKVSSWLSRTVSAVKTKSVSVVKTITATAKKVYTKASTVVSKAASAATTAYTAAKTFISNTASAAKSLASKAATAVKSAVNKAASAVNQAAETARAIAEDISEALEEKKEEREEEKAEKQAARKELVDGIIGALEDIADDGKEKVIEIWSDIGDAAADAAEYLEGVTDDVACYLEESEFGKDLFGTPDVVMESEAEQKPTGFLKRLVETMGALDLKYSEFYGIGIGRVQGCGIGPLPQLEQNSHNQGQTKNTEPTKTGVVGSFFKAWRDFSMSYQVSAIEELHPSAMDAMYEGDWSEDIYDSVGMDETDKFIGEMAGEYVASNDIVFDASLSIATPIPTLYIKMGASKIYSLSNDETPVYTHIGPGVLLGLSSPIAPSIAVGTANNYNGKNSYEGKFYNEGSGGGLMYDESGWIKDKGSIFNPEDWSEGVSSDMIELSPSLGHYFGLDFYFFEGE